MNNLLEDSPMDSPGLKDIKKALRHNWSAIIPGLLVAMVQQGLWIMDNNEDPQGIEEGLKDLKAMVYTLPNGSSYWESVRDFTGSRIDKYTK